MEQAQTEQRPQKTQMSMLLLLLLPLPLVWLLTAPLLSLSLLPVLEKESASHIAVWQRVVRSVATREKHR